MAKLVGNTIEIVTTPASFTEKKYDLYRKYQSEIHNDNNHNKTTFEEFLVDSPLPVNISWLLLVDFYPSFNHLLLLYSIQSHQKKKRRRTLMDTGRFTKSTVWTANLSRFQSLIFYPTASRLCTLCTIQTIES